MGHLVDAGALEPGVTTRWRWPAGLTVVIVARAGFIDLVTDDGIVQPIAIERIPGCRVRPWKLRCPRCTRRYERLIEFGGIFRCIDCHGFTRFMTPVTWRAIALRRQLGLGEALYGPLVVPVKPAHTWRSRRDREARVRRLERLQRYEGRLLSQLIRLNLVVELEAEKLP